MFHRFNKTKTNISDNIAEKALENLSEFLKVFQCYNINSSVLEKTIQMIFGQICEDEISRCLQKKSSTSKNDSESMTQFCAQIVDNFESLKPPKLTSTKLDNEKLKVFWKSNRDLYFDNFGKQCWAQAVNGFLSSEKPFGLIIQKWKELEGNFILELDIMKKLKR